MKSTVRNVAFTLMGSTSAAYAASGAEGEGSGLLLALFLGFGVLIILFQFVPGLALFFSMIKGLFSVARREPAVAAADESDKTSP